MASPFCISLAKPSPVHFQYCIPDCRTNSGDRPHKTTVANTDSARKPAQLLHRFLPQFANPKIEWFDRIVARRGLEKIKTIGDCYMAVGGYRTLFPNI
jgi:Adenylate and Guanylate cyclase catalytic domain